MRNLQDPELHEHENLTDSSNGFNRYDKTNDYSYLLEFLDQHILESKLIMKREITIIDNILKVNCGFPTIDLFASRISLFVIAIQFQCIAA